MATLGELISQVFAGEAKNGNGSVKVSRLNKDKEWEMVSVPQESVPLGSLDEMTVFNQAVVGMSNEQIIKLFWPERKV